MRPQLGDGASLRNERDKMQLQFESEHDIVKWLCFPKRTIEEAQELYKYELLRPAAVFELPTGGFSLGYIREQNYPPHETARKLKELLGFKMVSCCDPLLGVWKSYQVENDDNG